METSSSSTDNWKFSNKAYSKVLIKFIVQSVILFLIIIVSILNLSLKNGEESIWISLLSYSIGLMMNAPKIKKVRLHGGINGGYITPP